VVALLVAKGLLKLSIVLAKKKAVRTAAMTGVVAISSTQEIIKHNNKKKFEKKEDLDDSVFKEQKDF